MFKKSFTILALILFPLMNLLAQKDSSGAGYSLKFTGANGSYASIRNNFNTLNFPLTIEAWINLSGYPNVEGSIFASDNKDIYSGFWFNVNQAGNLFIEFGDNAGAGEGDRRGVETINILPLHKWVHVAAVCHSITDIQLYFNGVLQNSVSTDGTSTLTTISHNSGSGTIGNWMSISRETPFLGQIDELRIWRTARTQNQIQQNMCSHVTPVNALAGYWRGVGSLTSLMVTDYAIIPHNGTIVGFGKITKVVSGAPVGDFSTTHFGSFANRILTLADPSGDTFKVSEISGDPFGVSVYGVDQAPHFKNGLDSYSAHYFGVFCAEDSAPCTFKIRYHYANSSIGGNLEVNARIFFKSTDSSMFWTTTGPKPNQATNTLAKNDLASRGDYILNFIHSVNVLTQPVTSLPAMISAFPNPAHNYIALSFKNSGEPVNVIRIVNLTGEVIREIQNPSNNSALNLDIVNWSSGIYFAEAMTAKGNYFTRFIIQ